MWKIAIVAIFVAIIAYKIGFDVGMDVTFEHLSRRGFLKDDETIIKMIKERI